MPDATFKEFVLDQLHGLAGVEGRAMFGGVGLYRGGKFFGIIFKGALYFKTTEQTARLYLERGMEPFQPSATQTLKNYYEVPPDVIENARELERWANNALGCAR